MRRPETTLVALAAWLLASPGRLSGADASVASVATVASVGTRSITAAELEKHVRGKLAQLEIERYDALKAGLAELVEGELLKQEARARAIPGDALVKQEIDAKAPDPTDAEVLKFFAENKDKVGDAKLEEVKPRIARFLKDQRTQDRRAAFLAELRAKYKTSVTLKAPLFEVATAGRPERGGGARAPVTIVMFSDYQCGFCKQAEPTVSQVLKTYGDKVRVVVRDLPLEMHPDARPAAEAAACANAQGRFWEYHDLLFANQATLSEVNLKEHARKAGLDAARFDQCLKERTFKTVIDKDVEDAANVGITGTPVFVVNGRMLFGALPFASFKEAIDEALASRVSPTSD